MVHMMWNNGMSFTPWMWLVMGGGTVAFWAATVLAVRWAFDGRGVTVGGALGRRRVEAVAATPADVSYRPGTGPLDLLESRLARGDIDVNEYARVRKVLVESNPVLGQDRSVTTPR